MKNLCKKMCNCLNLVSCFSLLCAMPSRNYQTHQRPLWGSFCVVTVEFLKHAAVHTAHTVVAVSDTASPWFPCPAAVSSSCVSSTDLPIRPFNSERHHVISAPATTVCFTMLEPELFSAVARSATPLRQCGTLPADLTDYFNNMLLFDFKCSFKTYFYKLSFAT